MNSYKRLNNSGTREVLLSNARTLFARDGFRGTSIRAITAAAGTNLGAVTYHFGSKRGLFDAVLEDATSPVRHQIAALEGVTGKPLAKIEATVRHLFGALRRDPEIPRLLLHVLAAGEPLPQPIRHTMNTIIDHLTRLIEAGQHDGSIREGVPQMLALAFGSQPMFFGIYRRALQEAIGLDQSDEDTSRQITETVIGFMQAGLTPSQRNAARTVERN